MCISFKDSGCKSNVRIQRRFPEPPSQEYRGHVITLGCTQGRGQQKNLQFI